MAHRFSIFTSPERTRYLIERPGETKLGQRLHLVAAEKKSELPVILSRAKSEGVRFVILGIPEDIGPRANGGRGGADQAWDAFLHAFLNIQANPFFDPSSCLLLGHVEVADIQKRAQKAELPLLRELCAEIDERVSPIIKEIVSAGLEPIVIGGGHNNAYPILKGVSEALDGQKLGCINCDPHADFRSPEGRHSGNGFRVAQQEGLLTAYTVIGLHESYNSKELLSAMNAAGYPYTTYEATHVRREISFEEVLNQAVQYLQASGLPVGLELDLDSIAFMPVSAETPCGLSAEDAAHYVHVISSELPATYLHIAEGAPCWHPGDGVRHVGRTIALQVMTYLKARLSHTS